MARSYEIQEGTGRILLEDATGYELLEESGGAIWVDIERSGGVWVPIVRVELD